MHSCELIANYMHEILCYSRPSLLVLQIWIVFSTLSMEVGNSLLESNHFSEVVQALGIG